MKKLKNIHPAIAFAAGILVTLIITAFVYVTACISEYKYEMYTLLPVEINYEKDGHVIERATDSLVQEIVIPMAHPEKMYFGKIESDEYIYIYQSSNANILTIVLALVH
jgi:hypothetical protein